MIYYLKVVHKQGLLAKKWLNAGVMIMNLKLARELETEKIIIPYLVKNNHTEEQIINCLFSEKKSFFKEKIVLHLDVQEQLKDFSNIVVVHYVANFKPFSISNKIFSKELFIEYHECLKPFMKNKNYYNILAFSSIFLNIFCSYKRRYRRFMKKRFNKPEKPVKSDYIEIISKYSIINKK